MDDRPAPLDERGGAVPAAACWRNRRCYEAIAESGRKLFSIPDTWSGSSSPEWADEPVTEGDGDPVKWPQLFGKS